MKILGRPRLSASEIEDKAATLLRLYRADFLDYIIPTPLIEISALLSRKYKVTFDFKASLGFSEAGERILGATNLKKWVILVDESLQKDQHKFNFTLAHELGHLSLHRKVTFINEESDFKNTGDTVQEVFNEKSSLSTEQDWLEWQANAYATSLVMPEIVFRNAVKLKQQEMGIGRRGKIFVDEQLCNKKAYYEIISRLSQFFQVSLTAIEYRLKKLDLVEFHFPGMKSISEILSSGDWASQDKTSPF